MANQIHQLAQNLAIDCEEMMTSKTVCQVTPLPETLKFLTAGIGKIAKYTKERLRCLFSFT